MSINKVLIVDDSSTDRSNLAKIVTDAGCTVITANNGREAVEQAKKEKPDIIFMDIVMDEMDGYEATRTLTNDSDTKNIPVIFVSSKRQKADRVWAKMQGGKDLVSKPFTAQQIMDQLKTYG
ncbi:response regulator [Methylophaga lonarensis]|uniref:response regulator n=1 Tax=Methylophaga lonarensis TaxID=999151 RepID=UPI003D292733